MKIPEVRAALEPMLAARLRPLLGARDLGNGTPLADGVATALAHDMATRLRKKGDDLAAAVAGRTDRDLAVDAQTVLDVLMMQKGSEKRILSTGGEITSTSLPGVAFARVILSPVRGVPGLHERTDRLGHPSRPGAERLRHEIASHLLRLRAMDVATPSADQIEVDSTQWNWRDIVRVPMRGGPGATFIHEETISAVEHMLDIEIDLIARTIAERQRQLWAKRTIVDAEYTRVRDQLKPLLDKAEADGLTMRLAGVDLNLRGLTPEPFPVFEVLGNDLKPQRWVAFPGIKAKRPYDYTKPVANQIATQRRRKRILDDAAAKGGRGRIDLVTLAALRDYSDDPEAVLRQIARGRKIAIDRPAEGRRKETLRMSWRNGRIESSFNITRQVSWSYGKLTVRRSAFPESVLVNLPGRPISTLLEHPYFQPTDTIRSTSSHGGWMDGGGWTNFNVKVGWATFDAETGRIIGDAPPAEAFAQDLFDAAERRGKAA